MRSTLSFLVQQARAVPVVSVEQLVCRVAVAAGPPLALLAVHLAGGRLDPLPSVLAIVLGVGAAVFVESQLVAAAIVVPGVVWLARVADRLSAWSILAAAGLAMVHFGALLATIGPAGHRLDTDGRRRWALRAAVVAVVTVALWTVGTLVRRVSLEPSRLALGVGLGVIGAAVAVGAGLAVRGRAKF